MRGFGSSPRGWGPLHRGWGALPQLRSRSLRHYKLRAAAIPCWQYSSGAHFMRLNTMRTLDRWLGIPLCFLSSCLLRIFALWRRGRAVVASPRRVLFLELSEMGSTVIAQPAMRQVRDNLHAELYFAIFARNVESLRLLQMVPENHLFLIRDDHFLALAIDSVRFLLWTRRQRIDTVLDLELFSRYSALLCGLSGAQTRVGFHRFHAEGLYRGSMLTHPVSYNGHIHMAKNFLAMVYALSAPAGEFPFAKTIVADEAIRVTPAVIDDADRLAAQALVRQVFPHYRPSVHRIVLLNPNSSEMLPQRRWPSDHFLELAKRMVAEWPDVLVAFTGSSAEREDSLQLERQAEHPRIRSLAGMHALRMLLPLYAISHVLVTNDSGPAHFSALTSIRSIVLFGPETPTLYGSLGNTESLTLGLACSPCVSAANQKNSACTDAVCMRTMSPWHVLAAVRRVLDAPSGTAFPFAAIPGAATAQEEWMTLP